MPESIQKLTECHLFLENLHLGKEANPNLSHQEIKALNKLRKKQDLVNVPADKGSKIVFMDKTQYLIEANRHLQNPLHYRPLPGSLQRETQDMIKPIINKLHIYFTQVENLPAGARSSASFTCCLRSIRIHHCGQSLIKSLRADL